MGDASAVWQWAHEYRTQALPGPDENRCFVPGPSPYRPRMPLSEARGAAG